MRIKDLMSRRVVTVEGSESCEVALSRMHQARVRHLPVVDRAGHLVGVATDRDLRHHLFSPSVYSQLGEVPVAELLKAATVAQIMSAPVVHVSPEADLLDAARLMREGKVGSLPVVDGGVVVGIITETDLLRHVCGADATCPPEVAEIVVSYP